MKTCASRTKSGQARIDWDAMTEDHTVIGGVKAGSDHQHRSGVEPTHLS